MGHHGGRGTTAAAMVHRVLLIDMCLVLDLCVGMDPKINFVFVLHKRLFVFVHAIRLCAVPELNFVRWRKRGS